MIKGLIFDLDGVIVSTDDLHYMAWKKIALEEGIPFDKSINHKLRGVSRMASLEIILSKAEKTYEAAEKVKLATIKNDYYVALLEQLSQNDILPQVVPTLTKLRKLGYKLAIGSSSRNAKKILTKLGITDLFDVIVDGNDIINSKPDPEVFLKAAERLGLDPIECVVIEDAESGIEASIQSRMIAFGIGEASRYNKTHFPIKNIAEILNVIHHQNT
jgi:beta-phosphoglucomutase